MAGSLSKHLTIRGGVLDIVFRRTTEGSATFRGEVNLKRLCGGVNRRRTLGTGTRRTLPQFLVLYATIALALGELWPNEQSVTITTLTGLPARVCKSFRK